MRSEPRRNESGLVLLKSAPRSLSRVRSALSHRRSRSEKKGSRKARGRNTRVPDISVRDTRQDRITQFQRNKFPK